MASSPSPSPTLTASTSEAATAAVPPPSPFTAVARSETPTTKTLRGLNKPKCRVCGNVARSRCPFESCKSCCSKAQNPCHIHVLKANTTVLDKASASNSPQLDQSTESSPSGNSHRVASLRQLSNKFAQFNNVHIRIQTGKPLTKKDAVATNGWRFSKLKEFRDRNIEVENEAFDRYMQNISLLEEVFCVNSDEDNSIVDGSFVSNNDTTTTEGDNGDIVSGLKLKLRSNPMRTSNFRKRIQQIVDQGLKKLKACEPSDLDKEPSNQIELDKGPRTGEKSWAERASALSDFIDKLNKARNEEDLQSCMEMKNQLFGERKSLSSSESVDADTTEKHATKNDLEIRKESQNLFPRLVSTTANDQETLNSVSAHFSSLEQIEGL